MRREEVPNGFIIDLDETQVDLHIGMLGVFHSVDQVVQAEGGKPLVLFVAEYGVSFPGSGYSVRENCSVVSFDEVVQIVLGILSKLL